LLYVIHVIFYFLLMWKDGTAPTFFLLPYVRLVLNSGGGHSVTARWTASNSIDPHTTSGHDGDVGERAVVDGEQQQTTTGEQQRRHTLEE
jgi:hypothetical protein